MPFFETGAAHLHFEWAGRDDGPVLLLSHSLGSAMTLWTPQLEALGAHFQILLHDHRGHGQSSAPAAPWTMDDFGHDVVALLDHLELDRVHFCGVSLGGIVGLWLGQQAPERIERLVLCNCSAVIENPALLRDRMAHIEREGLAGIANDVMERWLTPAFHSAHPGVVERLREGVLRTSAVGYLRTCEALCNFDLRLRLASMRMDCLVVLGQHDRATPPAWTRAFAREISRHQLIELNSAHLANVEAADAFNRAVLEFLS
jgi:3-oxoadipate enol-lactonase